MLTINLRQGINDNSAYKAFKFPGGEIHFILSEQSVKYIELQKLPFIDVIADLTNSDGVMLLAIVCDTLNKDWPDMKIRVTIPYMAYQQADRDFAIGESFSLSTILRLLNSLNVSEYRFFDLHSDVTASALKILGKKCISIPNNQFIGHVFFTLNPENTDGIHHIHGWYSSKLKDTLTILSPDAGAYKKIFKLADNLQFTGGIECANKFRNTQNGNIDIQLSTNDFKGKDVLIIDDICVGGRTFTDLGEQLKDKNCGKLYLAVTHGIFSNGFEKLSQYFHTVFTTNSWRKDLPTDSNIQGINVNCYNCFNDKI